MSENVRISYIVNLIFKCSLYLRTSWVPRSTAVEGKSCRIVRAYLLIALPNVF